MMFSLSYMTIYLIFVQEYSFCVDETNMISGNAAIPTETKPSAAYQILKVDHILNCSRVWAHDRDILLLRSERGTKLRTPHPHFLNTNRKSTDKWTCLPFCISSGASTSCTASCAVGLSAIDWSPKLFHSCRYIGPIGMVLFVRVSLVYTFNSAFKQMLPCLSPPVDYKPFHNPTVTKQAKG